MRVGKESGGEVLAEDTSFSDPCGFVTTSDALNTVDMAFIAKRDRPLVG